MSLILANRRLQSSTPVCKANDTYAACVLNKLECNRKSPGCCCRDFFLKVRSGAIRQIPRPYLCLYHRNHRRSLYRPPRPH